MTESTLIETEGLIREMEEIFPSMYRLKILVEQASEPELCYAIRLGILGKSLTRPYSPVKYFQSVVDCIVKIYPQEEENEMFTPDLQNLGVGDKLRVLWYTPKYKITDILAEANRMIYMISAGTGATPMMQILEHANERKNISKFVYIGLSRNINQKILKSAAVYPSLNLAVIDIFTSDDSQSRKSAINKIEHIITEGHSISNSLYLVCGPDSFVEVLSGKRKGTYGRVLMKLGVPEGNCIKF